MIERKAKPPADLSAGGLSPQARQGNFPSQWRQEHFHVTMMVAGSLQGPGPMMLRARTRNQVSLPRGRPVKVHGARVGEGQRFAPGAGVGVEGPLAFVAADVATGDGIAGGVDDARHVAVPEPEVGRPGRDVGGGRAFFYLTLTVGTQLRCGFVAGYLVYQGESRRPSPSSLRSPLI
jgi:hypothetical protein